MTKPLNGVQTYSASTSRQSTTSKIHLADVSQLSVFFMPSCYCGSTQPYSECCQPVHNDHHQAQTPEQLMRARYSAHVNGSVDFVVNTYHPSCHAENEREAIADSIKSDWQRLEVINSQNGANTDEGFVHFKAFFKQGDEEFCLEERSRFIRENGLWYYIDGVFPQQLKVGRNDPCPCGSGKKYKKCCG